MTLRLSNATGVATLTLPKRVGLGDAVAFAERQYDWLLRNLAKRPVRTTVQLCQTLPFRGKGVHLAKGGGRSVGFDGESLTVPGHPDLVGRKLQGWLRAQARIDLTHASLYYAEKLGRQFTNITLRDTRSRWGSCSSGGSLMYSWRLILAPTAVLDYVAAHEVAHLAVMNHSAEFWLQLGALKPDYAENRDWLRKNGSVLHSYDFS